MSPDSPTAPHLASSPRMGGGRRRSRFTYRQLHQLTSYQPANPLRVVAHIDLDAFYAQCEMVRLGVPEDKPLAVQQWQGLIAINYPARAAGIGRHCDVNEAKKLCPELIAQHVATWREGDDKWAYRDDAAANIAKDKVSLDPYRLQSRKILALVKECLPADKQRVEKASIDEVFLDLSAHVHSLLIERFPELSNPPPYDDPSEKLPLPSIAALDWQADALVDLDEDQEALDPDWDDVAILLGSEIVRQVRAKVLDQLHYTCSGGVAQNKLVSKLGSGFKKPNRQTVVRSRAVQSFLETFKITKFRNLGGKLGEQVVSSFGTENVKELLLVPLDQMKVKLGEETGQWLHNTIRGIDTSEVNSRTQIKSMLSAKSFRPTISNPDQAVKWLRIFVADIFARLVEEGVLENKRRPRSIILHHRYAGQARAPGDDPRRLETRSRGESIPSGRTLDEDTLFRLAKDLLGQISGEGRVWPCSNLSLSVSGFEEGVKGNMGIGAFLVRGEEAEFLRQATPDNRISPGENQPAKKRRVEGPGIRQFFGKGNGENFDHEPRNVSSVADGTATESSLAQSYGAQTPPVGTAADAAPTYSAEVHSVGTGTVVCSRCQAAFQDEQELMSHSDWHMAKDLQEEERVRSTVHPTTASTSTSSAGPSIRGSGEQKRGGRGGRGKGRGAKTEQGQRKLNFG
ncbi:impB/mucB/samB family protein [Sarocladium implicatum]|nr:impB/mucB/samB family protein [Sarocladium implicatum]